MNQPTMQLLVSAAILNRVLNYWSILIPTDTSEYQLIADTQIGLTLFYVVLCVTNLHMYQILTDLKHKILVQQKQILAGSITSLLF